MATTDKVCRICNCTKDIDDFSRNGTNRSSYCRPCEVEYKRQYRMNNREKAHLKKIRDRAKEKGIEFDISMDDFIIPEVCPVLGIKLERGSNRDAWPSLDRIDPHKGYTKDNVVVVSFLANRIKNNASVEQIGKVYKFYEQLQTRLTSTTNNETYL